jgi:hypothetical protein
MSALAIEVLLKAFLAKRESPWVAETEHGHPHLDLFKKLSDEDRQHLGQYFDQESAGMSLMEGLQKFSRLFVDLRYPYETNAPRSYGSEVVYFARALCDSVYNLGMARQA